MLQTCCFELGMIIMSGQNAWDWRACLHFNVAGVDNVALDVAVSVAERGLCLALCGAQELDKVLLALCESHTAPATTRSGLDHQGEPDVVRHLHNSIQVPFWTSIPKNTI